MNGDSMHTTEDVQNLVAQWRERGHFAYPLNEEGKVARLEDARELAKTLSNGVMLVLSDPEVMMTMMLLCPDMAVYLGQMALVVHNLACVDPDCKINHPELGEVA